MARYEYKCASCGEVEDYFQSIHETLPTSRVCVKCGGESGLDLGVPHIKQVMGAGNSPARFPGIKKG